jgi:hypothetical protein
VALLTQADPELYEAFVHDYAAEACQEIRVGRARMRVGSVDAVAVRIVHEVFDAQ